MEDKKQIEEIEELVFFLYENKNYTVSEFAKALYEQNYRKIPEDAVVLTVEKIAKYEQELREKWEKDIDQARKEMLKDCIESNKIASQTYYERGCKETAREILTELYHREEMSFEVIKWYAKEYWGVEVE